MLDFSSGELVAVVVGLVWSIDWHAEIFGLLRCQPGELHADLLEVQARDFFVELLRQDVNARFVFVFPG